MTDTSKHDTRGVGDVIYRAFTPDLEVRSGGNGRTIVGIAVPYGRPQWINPALTEQFRRGAFNGQLRAAHRIPFAREHLPLGGTLIGRTTMLRDDAAGLYGEWRISKTPAGDETLELVRDGVLSQLSIGFRERTNAPLPGRVVERVTAELREVAVVMEGAYGEHALVAAVRAAGLPYAGQEPPTRDRAEEARRFLADLGLPDAPGARR